MLLLGRTAQEINGISIYPDHEDTNQFWYLSGPVRLSERNSQPVFTLIKYNPDIQIENAQGGGYVTFEVNIGLTSRERENILSQLPPNAKLAPVAFNRGTVQCLALSLGEEEILGAVSPSLVGENAAIFSLTLNENQTAILEQAFERQGQPIGVIYNLEYTAMTPALDVRLTANLERVYEEFQITFGFEGIVPTKPPLLLDASLETALQNLVQNGDIDMEVVVFIDEEDIKRQRDEALRLFLDILLKDWFVPTLELPRVSDEDDRDELAVVDSTGTPTPETTESDNSLLGDVQDIAETAEEILPQAKLKLRFVEQTERKTITYEFRGSQTTTKTYHPQGFFGLLLENINKNEHFILANLDDPFFRNLEIQVEAPENNYEKYGLQSVNFAARYDRKQEEVLFEPESNEDKTIKFGISKNLNLEYEQQIQYHFLADSDWEGEKLTYEIPWKPTTDRTPRLQPQDIIDFLEILVVLESNFFWGQIEDIFVYLSYQSPTGWQRTTMLHFNPESKTQQYWKLRLYPHYQNPQYTYSIEYKLTNGAVQTIEPVTTNVLTAVIQDLTVTKLPVRIIGQLQGNEKAFVDLLYSASEPVWRKTIELVANSPIVEVQIPLQNSDRKQFSYQVTIVKSDGRIFKQDFPTDNYTLPIVVRSGEDLQVEIVSDNLDWDFLRRVAVNLRYSDLEHNIHESETVTLTPRQPSYKWLVSLAQPNLKTYQWQAIFYTKDRSVGEQGIVRVPATENTWESTQDPVIFLSSYQPQKPRRSNLAVDVIPDDLNWELLRRVTVNLRYRDPEHNIDELERRHFNAGDEPFFWELEIANRNKQDYEWQAIFYLKDRTIGDRGRIYYPAKDEWETTNEFSLFLDSYLYSDFLDFSLVDEEGKPVANEPYRVILADGSEHTGRLDFQGKAHIEGLFPGNARISFYELDTNDWQKV